MDGWPDGWNYLPTKYIYFDEDINKLRIEIDSCWMKVDRRFTKAECDFVASKERSEKVKKINRYKYVYK